MTTKTTKTITGEITDTAFKLGTTGEYVEVKLQEMGKTSPLTYRSFLAEVVAQFKARPAGGKGLLAQLVFEEQHSTWENKPITYRNIVRVLPPAGDTPDAPPFPVPGATRERPQTAKEAPQGASAPQEPASIPPVPKEAPGVPETKPGEYLDGLECPPLIMGADKYSAANERYVQWHMDRRTALMQATEAMKDQPDTTGVILEAAEAMFAWLRGVSE